MGQPARPTLRWYQQEAVDAVMRELEAHTSTLLIAATGAGKTQMFSEVALRFLPRGPVLVMAHRKELVYQAADRLHLVTGIQPHIEMADEWSGNGAEIVCASLQTVIKRLERWEPDHFSLVIFDECFPAGTLVDGRPIESIMVGDYVSSVDHRFGTMRPRRVTRLFKKQASNLVKLCYGATTLTCTGNHPVFVKGRGYVEAEALSPGDLLCMRGGVHVGTLKAGNLQRPVQGHVAKASLIGDYDAHQSKALLSSYEAQEPHASGGYTPEGIRFPSGDGACAEDTWREWVRDNRTTSFAAQFLGEWVGAGVSGSNASEEGERLPELLQTRPGLPVSEDWDRGGREQSHVPDEAGSGLEENSALVWVRLDRVESVECGSAGTTVYNLEVEGGHTYFANDTLVHNCHHSLAKSFRKPLERFTGARQLGVTATPDRGDKKALGQLWRSVAYSFDIVDGIEHGYLVPIKGRSVVVQEIDLSGVQKTAGDLQAGQLDEVVASGVEGIVKKTLELEPDRQGIWFFPGVKSAELACDRINSIKPGSAAFVCGATPPEERDVIVRAFRRNEVQHLCNCQVATEGFDAPSASMVVIGRPTLSRALYAQMVGRGLRVLPGVVDGLDPKELASLRRDNVSSSAKPDCVVFDYCGNSGKHTLVTPEDLLGGDYSDEEVKLAKKKAKEASGADVGANLKAARAELQAAMAAMKSKVKAQVDQFDPFKITGTKPVEGGGPPINPHQRQTLMSYKLTEAEMKGLSQEGAAKLIRTLGTRRKLGLASHAQCRVLSRHQVPTTKLSFRVASKMIDYIASTGWRPDAETLRRMAG